MSHGLVELDDDVDELRRKLQVAHGEIKLLQAVLDRRASISPSCIGHLPAEVMGEIFLFFAASHSPLVLCWVCHNWRVISTNLTRLWLHPTFSLGAAFFPTNPTASYPDARVEQFVEQMCQWLDRVHSSDSVSLSILRGPHAYRWNEIPLMETLVIPYANCFQSLVIDTTQGQLARLLGAGLTFPNLESLSLHLPFLDLAGWVPQRGGASIPSLHHLVIRSEKVVGERHPITSAFFSCFPWSQIVSLNMKDVALDFWMWQVLVPQCTSLRFGKFSLRKIATTFNHGHHSTAATITTQLTSLLVKFITQIDVAVFEGLTFPAMEKLHIAGCASVRGKRNLVAWLQEHGACIRRLTLEMNIADDSGLRDLLLHLPRIAVLELYLDFRISCLVASAVLEAIGLGHLKSLNALTLCSNGVVERHKVTRPAMFNTYIEALIFATEAWAAGETSHKGFRIRADGEILAELKPRLASMAGIRTVLISPTNGPFLQVHAQRKRERRRGNGRL
ncbi:hypothetical protein C8R46DRAFT_1042120 [Mycena filopes]|nr:hypothetical protein C8R46DRAFT_1042120 [Mycena filopes]